MRNTPIMTFINKLDREGRMPLELLQEIEDKLQVECSPLSWPIGMGKTFRGVYNLYKKEIILFKPGQIRRPQDNIVISDIDDPKLDEILGSQANELRDDIELLEGAANPFDLDHYLKGNQTPVFFGSAVNNFGVQELLDAFVEMSPPPRPRQSETREVSPYETDFTGFAFKIQANMDLAHRDRIAFVRICSGKFTKGMKVLHHRIGKPISFNNATIFMAQDRKNIEEAYPGDIIGIHNRGTIKIGDTFSIKEPIKFTGIPNFAPEIFKRVILKNPLKSKQLQKGLLQLSEEGAVQVFRPLLGNDFILGAVGVLQFDVTMARLKTEYSVDAIYETVDYSTARWIESDNESNLEEFKKRYKTSLALDSADALTFLSPDKWRLNYVMKEWPEIKFNETREHE